MARFHIVAYVLLGLVIGALATSLVNRATGPSIDVAAVQAIVKDEIARHDAEAKPAEAVAQVDQKTIDPMIESFLMRDPHVLERATAELDRQNKQAAAVQMASVIKANHDAIFNEPGQIVVGNPKGDVTLVEMFDYNCTYCRGALPDLAQLLNDDKNLKVVLKEFPILSPGSVEAAKVAVAVSRSGADYWAFHQALFQTRGQVDGQTALNEAKAMGLDPDKLKAQSSTPDIAAEIQKSYQIATSLNITGTPTYIIGDEIIPGAVGIDQLKARIDNMRKCGKTVCDGSSS